MKIVPPKSKFKKQIMIVNWPCCTRFPQSNFGIHDTQGCGALCVYVAETQPWTCIKPETASKLSRNAHQPFPRLSHEEPNNAAANGWDSDPEWTLCSLSKIRG